MAIWRGVRGPTLHHSAEDSGELGADTKLELSKGDGSPSIEGCVHLRQGPLSEQETLPSTREAAGGGPDAAPHT